MSRIVIAGASDASRAQLSRLLAASGNAVFQSCASGGELRRALSVCEDGVVLIAGSLPDILPNDLAQDFGDSFQILLIGRPDVLEACESPRVFRLAYPCPGSAVLAAVEMLSQLHTMRLPHRSREEKALVEDAKRVLMLRDGIDEPEAHRRMQLYAMRNNMKMTDYAAMVLRDEELTGTQK